MDSLPFGSTNGSFYNLCGKLTLIKFQSRGCV